MDNGYVKRPTILQFEHIKHHPQCHEAYNFIRESSTLWNRSKLGIVVPDVLVQDLFYQLNLHPTKEQINDMLRNAKHYSSNLKFCNGLSFGEFSVLAADYRKFSSRTSQNGHHQPFQITSLSPKSSLRVKKQIFIDQHLSTTTNTINNTTTDGIANKSNNEESSKIETTPEVFLGGSCNPTTWRADVAMPELKKLGISFYNPQVSQWTPDLLQLEHRAKMKARVLFFVMDSQTRASAAAIEVAHIAGQNQKPLILVLQPYKRNQQIFNESISEEEFLDLSRNQKILKQLVSRRGLPVHENILLGLQKIKSILAGDEGPCSSLPQSVGSRLISIRRSFDRVIDSGEIGLTLKQCNQQLLSLGYRKDLISIENLKRILSLVRDVLNNRNESSVSSTESSSSSEMSMAEVDWESPIITFEEFCVVSSYLSVLQQEIEDNCCVSPIKGTNLPPPPIFLTNTPEVLNQYSKQCSQTDENTIVGICSQQQRHTTLNQNFTVDGNAAITVKEERETIIMTMSNGPRSDSSRDSGTSSPQPIESKLVNGNSGSSLNTKMSIHNRHADIGSTSSTKITDDDYNDIDSDSNDSVFSTSSSLEIDEDSMFEVKDIYLGGSCLLRTKWRQDIAIPYLKSKNISYYLPTIHDNLTLKETKKARKFNRDKNESGGGYSLEETVNGDDLMFNPRILDSSRVLLFVITNETRSLAPMTLAAHYIGLAYNVVLCIQMLPDNCTIGNDKLTPSAIKDYNRGRTYLRDLAERQNIPVFDEIKQALDCAIDKVKLSKPRCSV
ncbi:hypothetical protein PVAND_012537 [Polypedilum vanderplanki]|uniref:Nucleoside 2-deoxyribosyltransferase like protein n=1 Tax=Polypedilum vanderplanki TaxID=319348 RepID=A0A9J6CMU3_POLVA|nr:hypothetical protein PVAND_012537 [Polypedilum vanderplanki]